MIVSERLELIEKWYNRMEDVDAQIKALEKVFGRGVVDSKFVEVIEWMMQEYTDAMSMLIGDQDEILSWYLYDNDKGKRKLKVKCRNGKRLKVSNLEELCVAISYNLIEPSVQ